MKIVYFLKKGFQFFPPCLAQVLYLKDLGAELEIYHGKNTTYIDTLFDNLHLIHHELKSDGLKNGKIETAKKMIKYRKEAKSIVQNIPKERLLWFGNCESLIPLNDCLNGRKFVASILELYDDQKLIDELLKRVLPKAAIVLCCERHRAMIMRGRYQLKKSPFVMPNKAYAIEEENADGGSFNTIDKEVRDKIERYKDCRVVLYQGIISRDRPLSSIARALASIGNPKVVFWIMGKGDLQLIEEVKSIYSNTVYFGYVPSPQHMIVTQYAHIGIANYDYSNLNNIFCAPNKIYEYSKFGMPMLTSDNIGLTETVGAAKAAECVDFSNEDAICDGLSKILDDYETYHENALEFYRQTNNRGVMEEIYEELVSL